MLLDLALDSFLDWRHSGRYGPLYEPLLLAGDITMPPSSRRFVLSFRCGQCHGTYLAAAPIDAVQRCPDCGAPLRRMPNRAWDLREEAAPRWWRDRLDGGLP